MTSMGCDSTGEHADAPVVKSSRIRDVNFCVPCYISPRFWKTENIRGIRAIFARGSRGFRGVPGASAVRRKKYDCEKYRLRFRGGGSSARAGPFKIKKRETGQVDGFGDAVWES